MGTDKVRIVQDNCYSSAVSARLISDGHKRRETAEFSYKTFSMVNAESNMQEAKLKCKIRLCLNDDDMCILSDEEYCEGLRKQSGYEFTLDGTK